jgi:O-antigen ligase
MTPVSATHLPSGLLLRVLRGYARCLAVAILALMLLDIPSYAHLLNQAILPRDWFLAMLLLALPAFVIEPHALAKGLTSPFAIWCLSFVGINALYVLGADQEVASVAATRAQLGLLAIFFGAVLHLHLAPGWARTFPLLTILISCLVIADLFLPNVIVPSETDGYIVGRAAGPYINPNKAGEAILLAILLSIPVASQRYRTLLLLLGCFAIVATFSRAAIMGWGVLTIWGALAGIFARYAVFLPVVLIGSLNLIGDWLLDSVYPILGLEAGSANVLERIASILFFQFVDLSVGERSAVLTQAFELFGDNPFFGSGPGATFVFFGPHNQAALMAAEYGLAGLILWFWLLVLVATGAFFIRPTHKYLALTIIVLLSFFSHNLLDHAFWIFALAIFSSRAIKHAFSRGNESGA